MLPIGGGLKDAFFPPRAPPGGGTCQKLAMIPIGGVLRDTFFQDGVSLSFSLFLSLALFFCFSSDGGMGRQYFFAVSMGGGLDILRVSISGSPSASSKLLKSTTAGLNLLSTDASR